MPDCLYNVTLYAILYSIGIRAQTVLQNAERNSVKIYSMCRMKEKQLCWKTFKITQRQTHQPKEEVEQAVKKLHSNKAAGEEEMVE